MTDVKRNSIHAQIQACPEEGTAVRNKEKGVRLHSQPGVVNPTGGFSTGWSSADGIFIGTNATFAVYMDAVYTGKVVDGSRSKFTNPNDQSTLKPDTIFTLSDCAVKNPTADELNRAPIVHNLKINTKIDNLSVNIDPITGGIDGSADAHFNVEDQTNAQFIEFPKLSWTSGVGLIYGGKYNRFANSKRADQRACLNKAQGDQDALASCDEKFPEDVVADKYHTSMSVKGGYAFEINRSFDEDAESTLDPLSFKHVFNFRLHNSSIDPSEQPGYLASHTMSLSSSLLLNNYMFLIEPKISRTVTDGADEQFSSSQDNNTTWDFNANLIYNNNSNQETNKQYVDGWLTTAGISHSQFGNGRLDDASDGHSTEIKLKLENTLPAWSKFGLNRGSFDSSFKLTELAGSTNAPFYLEAGLKWYKGVKNGAVGAIRPDGTFSEIDDCYSDFVDGGTDGVCHKEGQYDGGNVTKDVVVPYSIGFNLPLNIKGEKIFKSGMILGFGVSGELEPLILKALVTSTTFDEITRRRVVGGHIGGNF